MLIEIKVTLGIVLVIVFLGGVICNVAVLVLPPPRWTKNMKTGNKLIKSLHAIDLIICICLMPITFSVLMNSPEVNENLCFFHESLISFATSGGCINILFISLERYLSIGSLNSKSSKPSIIFLSIIWITSFIGFGLPWINAVVKTEDTETLINEEKNLTIVDCEHLVTSFNKYNVYEVFGLGIFFLTCIGIVVCYIGIFKLAKRGTKIHDQNNGHNQRRALAKKKREKRALKITLSLVGSFILCWFLFIVISLVEMVSPSSVAINITHLVSLCIVFSSTIVHPTLYRFIHVDIKQIFKKTDKTIESSENSISATGKSKNVVCPEGIHKVTVNSHLSVTSLPIDNQTPAHIFTTETV
jgi:hypothetical protein